MDTDEDAEIIFNTIVDSEKENAKGIKQTKIDTARKMKDKSIDINTISKIAELTTKKIKKL